jgi:hypothetical protein
MSAEMPVLTTLNLFSTLRQKTIVKSWDWGNSNSTRTNRGLSARETVPISAFFWLIPGQYIVAASLPATLLD